MWGVNSVAHFIFGEKTKKYIHVLKKLEKEAKKAKIDISEIYFGLMAIKELIKNEKDLEEMGKEIVKLGRKAKMEGLDVDQAYYGLNAMKEVIKNKEDLEEIVKLGIEAARSKVSVLGMYGRLEDMKEKVIELKNKFGKEAYNIIKKAAVEGLLDSTAIDELSKAYEQGKLEEKIDELKKRK